MDGEDVHKHGKEDSDHSKISDSASEEDHSSDDDVAETGEHDSSSERHRVIEEGNENEYDDTIKTDEADEHSDSGHQRQSKRKPSKSRIKRILNKELPVQYSQENPFPLPSIDSLMMVGGHSSVRNQVSMVPGPAPAYMQMTGHGSRQRSPGAYKCETCGKVFRVPSRFHSHMQSHSKGKPFCCDICGKMFATKEKLDIHTPVHNQNRSGSYECPQCHHKCANWRTYLYHVTRHTDNGGKKHTCNICGRLFFAAQRLRNHMRNHMGGKNYCCRICGKLFESKKRLETHSLIHNAERHDSFSCTDCGKVYDDWRAFKQHMKTHGSEGVFYTCEICSSQFITQYEKEKHMKVHASDRRYPCSQCKKFFRTQSQLVVHMRNKHKGNKSHECQICGRECARASGLKQHMKMHIGEENFLCHFCGQSFEKGIDLTMHASTHALERTFVCDQCGKRFAKKAHYHRHLIVHAAGQQFTCTVCGKGFEHSLQLTSHMTSHNLHDQNKFPCQACSCTFTSLLELEAHAHSHGKSPPYVCGLCRKLFAEQRYFRQHMKRHAANKKKLQEKAARQASGMQVKTKDAATSASQGSKDHKCYMCEKNFGSYEDLNAHIEVHKRHGLRKYLSVIGGKGKKNGQKQQEYGNVDAAYEEDSDTASDTEGPDRAEAKKNRTTIHFGMQNSGVNTSLPDKRILYPISQASDQATGFHGQISAAGNPNCAAPNNSFESTSGAPSVVSPELTPQDRNGDGLGNNSLTNSFFPSPTVFSRQPDTYVTQYHAAAHRFQHNSQDHFVNGNNTETAMDVGGHYGTPIKRLPDFSDFRHHYGPSNNVAGFSDYREPVSAPYLFSSPNQMQSMAGGYCQSEMPSAFYNNNGQPMSVNNEGRASVPVYPSMSVFPTMPSQQQGTNSHNCHRGEMQQDFNPMFHIRPLVNDNEHWK